MSSHRISLPSGKHVPKQAVSEIEVSEDVIIIRVGNSWYEHSSYASNAAALAAVDAIADDIFHLETDVDDATPLQVDVVSGGGGGDNVSCDTVYETDMSTGQVRCMTRVTNLTTGAVLRYLYNGGLRTPAGTVDCEPIKLTVGSHYQSYNGGYLASIPAHARSASITSRSSGPLSVTTDGTQPSGNYGMEAGSDQTVVLNGREVLLNTRVDGSNVWVEYYNTDGIVTIKGTGK